MITHTEIILLVFAISNHLHCLLVHNDQVFSMESIILNQLLLSLKENICSSGKKGKLQKRLKKKLQPGTVAPHYFIFYFFLLRCFFVEEVTKSDRNLKFVQEVRIRYLSNLKGRRKKS